MGIHILYAIAAVVLFGFMLPIYKRNIELFLVLLLIINFDFFKIVPAIGGFSDYREMLLTILVFALLFKIIEARSLRLDKYGVHLILFVLLVLIGLYQSADNGQPIEWGVKAAKYYALCLIFYIAYLSDINLEKLTTYLIYLGLLVTVILSIQYVFYKELAIVQIDAEQYATMRYGRLRFALGWQLISVAAVLALGKILTKKYSYLPILLYLSGFLIIVVQTRMLILALLLTFIMTYLASLKKSINSLVTIIIVAAIALPGVYVAYNQYLDSSMHAETMREITQKKGSYSARLAAFEMYSKEANKSPFLGYGISNPAWTGSPMMKLEQNGMHLSDIGVFSVYFYFGILGTMWFAVLLIYIIWDLVRYRTQILSVAPFFFLALFSMMTLDFFIRKDIILVFCLFLGLHAAAIRTEKRQTQASKP